MGIETNAEADAEQLVALAQEEDAAEIPPEYRGLGIIRLNSQEWWAASSIDEALKASAEHFRVPAHEVFDENYPPYRLSPDEMWSSTLYVDGQVISFMDALMRRMEVGTKVPHLFGVSD